MTRRLAGLTTALLLIFAALAAARVTRRHHHHRRHHTLRARKADGESLVEVAARWEGECLAGRVPGIPLEACALQRQAPEGELTDEQLAEAEALTNRVLAEWRELGDAADRVEVESDS
jgi:hypothetical protein